MRINASFIHEPGFAWHHHFSGISDITGQKQQFPHEYLVLFREMWTLTRLIVYSDALLPF